MAPGTPFSGTSARPSSNAAASDRRGSEKRSLLSPGEVGLREVGDVGGISGAMGNKVRCDTTGGSMGKKNRVKGMFIFGHKQKVREPTITFEQHAWN